MRKKKNCNKCFKDISLSNFNKHYDVCTGIDKEVIHLNKDWKQDNGKYKCPFCSIEFGKGITSHIWRKHTSNGLLFTIQCQEKGSLPIKGNIPWNKGKTKLTDDNVLKGALTLQKNIKSGKVSLGGNKPSQKVREKLSRLAAERIEKPGSGGFPNVKWYPYKNISGDQCFLRGTWELKVAGWLNNKNIIWIRNKQLKYFDGEITRIYLPDFYLPSENLYIEVKGYFSDKDKNKIKLVKEQNNITIKIFFKKEIDNLKDILL